MFSYQISIRLPLGPAWLREQGSVGARHHSSCSKHGYVSTLHLHAWRLASPPPFSVTLTLVLLLSNLSPLNLVLLRGCKTPFVHAVFRMEPSYLYWDLLATIAIILNETCFYCLKGDLLALDFLQGAKQIFFSPIAEIFQICYCFWKFIFFLFWKSYRSRRSKRKLFHLPVDCAVRYTGQCSISLKPGPHWGFSQGCRDLDIWAVF